MLSLLRDFLAGLTVLALLAFAPLALEKLSGKVEPPQVETFQANFYEPYYELSLARRGNHFAAVGMSGTICIGNVEYPDAHIETLLPEEFALQMEFSPTEPLLAVGCVSGKVLLKHLSPQTPPKTLTEFDDAAVVVNFSPNGRFVAAACAPYEQNPALIRVINLATGQVQFEKIIDGFLVGLAYSPDGRLIVTRNSIGVVTVLSSKDGAEVSRFDLSDIGIGPIAVGPRGLSAAVGGLNGQLVLLDLHKQRIAGKWTVSSTMIQSLAFAPRDRIVALGSTNKLILFDLKDHAVVAEQAAHVSDVEFLPNGKSLLTTGYDGTIRRWSVPMLSEEMRATRVSL